MKRWLALACFLATGWCCTPLPPPVVPDGQVHDLTRQVAVVAEEGQPLHCAGVFIQGGSVLTAAHCVTPNPEVASYDSFMRDTQVFWVYQCRYMDVVQDIAVLEPASSEGARYYEPAWLADSVPRQGSRVIHVGHVSSMPFSLSAGVVSWPLRHTKPTVGWHIGGDFIQTDTLLRPGGSGGGLWDARTDRLVGIASFFNRLSGMGYFVHLDAIKRALAAPYGEGCQ